MSKKVTMYTEYWVDWVLDTLGEPDPTDMVTIDKDSVYWKAIHKEWLEQSSSTIYEFPFVSSPTRNPYLFQVMDFLGEKIVVDLNYFAEDASRFRFGPELQRKLDVAKEWGAWG